MSEYTIYHNPRCSKSRQTLALLEKKGVKIKVIDYLKTPPSEATLKKLLVSLNLKASDLIRKKESLFKELSLEKANEATLLKAMQMHPKLIERPIVVHGNRAILGRPPLNVEQLLR